MRYNDLRFQKESPYGVVVGHPGKKPDHCTIMPTSVCAHILRTFEETMSSKF